MYTQALETFSLLKHQSNSINPLLEMIEDDESRPREVDSLDHIILARDLKLSPIA